MSQKTIPTELHGDLSYQEVKAQAMETNLVLLMLHSFTNEEPLYIVVCGCLCVCTELILNMVVNYKKNNR